MFKGSNVFGLFVLLLLICALTTAASCKETRDDGGIYQAEHVASWTWRFVDEEYGNVCYIYRPNSISCVPLSGTKRGQ
jgi:hypothetical protein